MRAFSQQTAGASAPCGLSQRDSVARRAPALSAAPSAVCRQRARLQPVRAVLAEPPPSVSPDFTTVPRPDKNGRYGKYGGKYVPETLISALEELETKYAEVKRDPAFQVRDIQSYRVSQRSTAQTP